MDGIRRSLMLALGLGAVACGTTPGGSDAETSGGSGSASGSGSESTTLPPSWPDAPWCGVPAPSDAPLPPTCDNPVPYMQDGPDGPVPSGVVGCDGGWAHRESAVQCQYPETLTGSCSLGGDTDSAGNATQCSSDDECTESPHGYCNTEFFDGGCSCSYGCESDADCGEDQACICAGNQSQCVPAYCHTDADCGDYLCQYYGGVLACQGAFDTCRDGSTCAGDCPACGYSPTDCAWACQPDGGTCTVGRPFIVDGHATTASPCERGDWSARGGVVEVAALTHAQRDAIARHWQAVGLAEHASVPAFARFALQQAALGAPADLMQSCAAAMADEIEHAKLAFELAARYGGVSVGPGPLVEAAASAIAFDLRTVTELVVIEACIGETVAAIEAAHAAARSVDGHVRATLERIAADELRHAELGWRFVAWALPQLGATDRAALRQVFARAMASRPSSATAADEAALAAHGVIGPQTAAMLREQALRGVIRPLAATLLPARAPGDADATRATAAFA
ncbi:MAG: ferritin-like domain-containing protein [Deltaproteobacteria bacterium]|nr:ferritin-like domain-containing protein [Deltaproteobacteria bacterium]MBK8713240.1 ferritin-like domain-containing protein [Deltaproteobacteria bacterium]MBP7288917.1 ferritin-like domain-containing protein [Nannocystaceae bacterium]